MLKFIVSNKILNYYYYNSGRFGVGSTLNNVLFLVKAVPDLIVRCRVYTAFKLLAFLFLVKSLNDDSFF